MSDANRVRIGYKIESTLGTTPSNPEFLELRVNGLPDLGAKPNAGKDEEIRDDRQIVDAPLLSADASGNINTFLSFENIDDVGIKGAFMDNWETQDNVNNGGVEDSVIIGVTGTSGNVSIAGSFGTIGDLVKLFGFDDSENNLRSDITAKTTGAGSGHDTVTFGNDAGNMVDDADPAGSAEMQVIGIKAQTNGDIQAVSGTPNQITFNGSEVATDFDIEVGDWIRVDGFSTTANNDWVRVSSIATDGTSMDLDVVPSGWATDTASSETVILYIGERIQNGQITADIDLKSHTIERIFQDHSNVTYEYFRGMVVNTINFNFPEAEKVEANMNMMGIDYTITETRESGATDGDPPTGDIFNTTDNIDNEKVDGTEISSTSNQVFASNIQINNNLRKKSGHGSLYGVDIGMGDFEVTGTIQRYFDSKDEVDAAIGNTAKGYMISVVQDNECYVFDVPKIKYTAGYPVVNGPNQEVVANMEFLGLRDTDLGYTMKVQRFYYVPTPS